MTQNIYDDPDFHAAYLRLPRSVSGLEGAPEWPSLRAMLPGLDGARVLDVGCGLGWFCRWARGAGAASVLGLDISERTLNGARAATDDTAITYARADLEDVALPVQAFDLAYSSLALHYIAGLDGLLAALARALVPGGMLVASVEHPVFTAPAAPGWRADAAGAPAWGLNGYLDEGRREVDWLGALVVKQHRTVAGWLAALRRAGFTLARLEEWAPSLAQLEKHPEWVNHRQIPNFLLFAATRA
jgi:SAM-dependent methyltransferase